MPYRTKIATEKGKQIIFLSRPECLSFSLFYLSKQVSFPNLQNLQHKGNKGNVTCLTPLSTTVVVLWIQELILTEQNFTLFWEELFFHVMNYRFRVSDLPALEIFLALYLYSQLFSLSLAAQLQHLLRSIYSHQHLIGLL